MIKFKSNNIVVIILCISIIFCLTSCSQTVKKKTVDPVTNIEAIEYSRVYLNALQQVDADVLKTFSVELSDSDYEYLASFDFDTLYGADNAEVYRAYFSRVYYEIDESGVKLDGDQATVPVKFTYVDYYKLEPEYLDAKGWVDAINSSENFEQATINLVLTAIEGEDGIRMVKVKNSEKIISKFFYDDVVNVYFYVDSYVFYDKAIKNFYWAKEQFEATDSLSFSFEYGDDTRPNSMDVKITLYDSSMNDIYEVNTKYYSNCIYGFSIKPTDVGLPYYEEGFYTITFETEDDSIYYNNVVYVNKYEEPVFDPNVSSSFDVYHGLMESADYAYSMPSEEILGFYDESTYSYVNEYFGIKFICPENYVNEYEVFKANCIGTRMIDTVLNLVPDQTLMLTINASVINIGSEINSREDLDLFLNSNGGFIYTGIPFEVGEKTVYVAYSLENAITYYMVPNGNDILLIMFIGNDQVKTSSIVDTFEPA